MEDGKESEPYARESLSSLVLRLLPFVTNGVRKGRRDRGTTERRT